MLVKKVLHIITGLDSGGAENALLRVLSRSKKFDHTVVSLTGRGKLSGQFDKNGIKTLHFGAKNIIGFSKSIFQLFLFLKKNNFNLIMTYLSHADLVGRILGKIYGTKVICNLRGWKPKWLTSLDVKTSGLISGYISNSIQQANEYRKHIDKNKILAVIPNGLILEELRTKKSRKDFCLEHSIDSDKKIVFSQLNLRPEKGVLEIVEVAKQSHDIQFVIAGDGPLKSKIESVETNNLKLLGFVSHQTVLDGMAICDVFLHPSHAEGMSNAVLEAAGVGCLMIVSDIKPNKDILVNNNYLLCEVSNVHSIKSALDKAFGFDKETVDTWKKNLSDYIAENFGIDKTVERFEHEWDIPSDECS